MGTVSCIVMDHTGHPPFFPAGRPGTTLHQGSFSFIGPCPPYDDSDSGRRLLEHTAPTTTRTGPNTRPDRPPWMAPWLRLPRLRCFLPALLSASPLHPSSHLIPISFPSPNFSLSLSLSVPRLAGPVHGELRCSVLCLRPVSSCLVSSTRPASVPFPPRVYSSLSLSPLKPLYRRDDRQVSPIGTPTFQTPPQTTWLAASAVGRDFFLLF